MAPEREATECIVGEFLKRVWAERGGGGVHEPLRELLEQLQAGLPGVAGALLLSAWPRSTPEIPVCSSAWDAQRLAGQEQLRALARFLNPIKEVTYHARSQTEPAPLSWLAGALRRNDPCQFAILPLRQFVPAEFATAPAFQVALVVAFARVLGTTPVGLEPEPYREDLEYLAWVIAHLRINWEAPRLARRSMDLAATIDAGVTHILTETPPWADAQEHFGQLVNNIRTLMGCDTCQLYLFPAYASCVRDRNADRIWLVAEQVANREGLRNLRSESSLVSHLWRNAGNAPLAISNLLEQAEYRHYTMSSLGLTRHFLGILLIVPEPYEVIGALTLRDRYARGEDGRMCIARDGFSRDDGRTLQNRAADLVRLICAHRGGLDAAEIRDNLRQEVDRIRRDLYADTAQLYLTPEVLGVVRAVPEDYLELYYHARRSWLGEANYGRGERLTGRVLAGKTVNEPDMFLRLTEQEGRAGAAARRKFGKYRLSQHFLAVPIPAPVVAAEGGPTPEAIGVLKVRDRLQRDHKTLATQGFSREDEYLLQAFARMISVKIAIRTHLLQRETEQRAQSTDLAHAYRHDLTNLLRPAMLRMRELPGDLEYVPRLLEQAGRMVDRSWKGARLAEGQYLPEERATCDLAGMLRELFPGEQVCLAPQCSCAVNLVVRGQDLPTDELWVRCDRTLLELAVLVLPVWLAQCAPHVGACEAEAPVAVTVSAGAAAQGAWLELSAPTANVWPPAEAEDDVRERGAHVCYTNLLVCPLVAWGAFVEALRGYDVAVDHACDAGTTRLRFRLDAAPAPVARSTARAATR